MKTVKVIPVKKSLALSIMGTDVKRLYACLFMWDSGLYDFLCMSGSVVLIDLELFIAEKEIEKIDFKSLTVRSIVILTY